MRDQLLHLNDCRRFYVLRDNDAIYADCKSHEEADRWLDHCRRQYPRDRTVRVVALALEDTWGLRQEEAA